VIHVRAPKGSGTTVRRLFLEGRGITAASPSTGRHGRARERAWRWASHRLGYQFETTFKKEVISDLIGERGVLMGCHLRAVARAVRVLRANGHHRPKAFNETGRRRRRALPLIAEKGMDWMYANCSTTAQRGGARLVQAVPRRGPSRCSE